MRYEREDERRSYVLPCLQSVGFNVQIVLAKRNSEFSDGAREKRYRLGFHIAFQ